MDQTNRLKLSGGPEKTATWIWLDAHGQLKIEFYDFSELAQQMFGNDIAYTMTVKEMSRLFLLTRQNETSVLPWMAETFQSYFGIKKWLEDNEIDFETERESWA